jgi:hypothetical protein
VWPLFQKLVNILETTPNSAPWQMFIEEPQDLATEVTRGSILLKNEVVRVFL